MGRVVHFEMMVSEPERAINFYQHVFGWSVQKWDGPMDYWLVSTGPKEKPGIDGGLMLRDKDSLQSVINTVEVESVDDFCEKVVAAGGSIKFPKMVIPNVGYVAYILDPEGNMLGIIENNPQAK